MTLISVTMFFVSSWLNWPRPVSPRTSSFLRGMIFGSSPILRSPAVSLKETTDLSNAMCSKINTESDAVISRLNRPLLLVEVPVPLFSAVMLTPSIGSLVELSITRPVTCCWANKDPETMTPARNRIILLGVFAG